MVSSIISLVDPYNFCLALKTAATRAKAASVGGQKTKYMTEFVEADFVLIDTNSLY